MKTDLANHIKELRDAFIAEITRLITGQKIVDVIFFPWHGHSPMVRVDGAGLNMNEATELEAAAEGIMVRLPDKVEIGSDNFFSALTNKYAKKEIGLTGDLRYCTELNETVTSWLLEQGVDLSELIVWEVDVESGGDISVRLVGEKERMQPREPKKIDDIRIEYVSSADAEETRAMLVAYDDAKRLGTPFLQHIQDL